ncbi:MAG: hypothetical protein A3B99_03545 [Candidatus Yanofskybacteria bacterium RIFCSPHIGHO2_02_FULL_44_12b]|uniref:Uncharacterized protein n=2 Tax=Candidatus Yanofskyibacteriota TaxID=1752733 RepID=A0A1F8GMT7_9BACT|nr:MAG: hypothetical protein UW79_C0010G0041 [Candidatus Yanofskybacteria bacterium GW2011_GWA2_44_9]OGN04740.1 MAG: hypothetical protein A2659_01295 [Candidatus Yanofskybacteria bacterium RIFCSPHIGHO2_01_FULL_44_24]OGN15596.1 MAG: hypothetical protein A3B99_03545 [Candidatus Yanofskybacteria bacterium RIFCSPHIGHO2_02_FULL_44_12b]OGN26651.1 MAG: hypothetical protein A2925_03630 [Candidatus Yanofskybacteria bacterium RIFCSPLOWO2_01_FULL_44_22]
MLNLFFFVLTAGVLILVLGVYYMEKRNLPAEAVLGRRNFWKKWALISLLFLPLNINGNVLTVFGSGVSDKDFYSAFSVYQRANNDVVSIFGGLWQESGRDVEVLAGLVGYQKAGRNASLMLGISGYQKAGDIAFQMFGINAFQEGFNSLLGGGISGYQKSYGDIGYRNLGSAVWLGLVGHQRGNLAGCTLGIVGFQNTNQRASTGAAVALYQRAGTSARSFAVFSQLKSPEDKPTEANKK